MLGESPRAEFAGRGTGVTVARPGFVDTGITPPARFTGAPGTEEDRLRERTARMHAPRNHPPEEVAAAIPRAVAENRAMVPVTPEARAAYLLSRIAPGALRALAGVAPPR